MVFSDPVSSLLTHDQDALKLRFGPPSGAVFGRGTVKEFERYPNRCYAGRSPARHYTHDVKLFFRWCQKPIAEVTPQDVASYVSNELARRLSKATINRRLASCETFWTSGRSGRGMALRSATRSDRDGTAPGRGGI